MQKEIRVVDYILNMTDVMGEYLYENGEESLPLNYIHAQALIFFKTFGLEISTDIVKAFNQLEENYTEEYYKALFLLYRGMTNGNATAFMGALQGYIAKENKNKEVS